MVQHASQMQLHRIKSFIFSKVGWVVAIEWGNTAIGKSKAAAKKDWTYIIFAALCLLVPAVVTPLVACCLLFASRNPSVSS